jgi:hypothetical protein
MSKTRMHKKSWLTVAFEIRHQKLSLQSIIRLVGAGPALILFGLIWPGSTLSPT